MKKLLIKSLDSVSLLTKVCPPSSVGLTFLQMENYFYCLLVYGRKIQSLIPNIVPFSIVKAS